MWNRRPLPANARGLDNVKHAQAIIRAAIGPAEKLKIKTMKNKQKKFKRGKRLKKTPPCSIQTSFPRTVQLP